jgi:hypothetical protein
MKDRRIRCEVSKTVQEQQYEPLQITLSLEGTISDKADMDKEYEVALGHLEEIVIEHINRGLT